MFRAKQDLIEIAKAAPLSLFLNLTGYIAFVVLVRNGLDPKISISFLYPVMVALSYFLYGNLVFHGEYSKNSLFKFIITHISGYLANLLLLFIFIDIFALTHELSQLIAMVIVALYLFLIFKFVVFTNQ